MEKTCILNVYKNKFSTKHLIFLIKVKPENKINKHVFFFNYFFVLNYL